MKLGIRIKLFLVSLGLIVFSVVVVYVYMRSELQRSLTAHIQEDLNVRVALIAQRAETETLELDNASAWHELANNLGGRAEARVTFVRSDGTVMGDSALSRAEVEKLENHRRRPEIERALGSGAQRDHAAFSSVDRGMLFVAAPFRRDGALAGVARVGVPLKEVDSAIAALREVLTVATVLALALAVVMSTVVAHFASRTARALTEAASRMAEGDLSTRTHLRGHDEFAELGRALDHLAQSLSSTLVELRDERDRQSGILSGMQEGVLLLDKQGRIALLNPALRSMLLLGADVVGKTLLEVIRHAELKELLDSARNADAPLSREIALAGLKPRRLLVRVAPVQGEQGGMFAVFVDVTEMRRLESLRRDFVANVSHELRTPVTAIRSAAETVEQALSNDPASVNQFLGIIARNAERLHDLVEDLLDLSRIESKELRLSYEALDLRHVFGHVISLFRERADKRQLVMNLSLDSDCPAVRADRRALEHVLTNLVDNAVKYCPPNSTIVLGGSVEDASVRITVQDTGPGIEERHLPRLFERFYRVDSGRSRELGGTGLGLSIVKHIVEAMGGGITVKSKLGQGTSFSFTLKRAGLEESLPEPAVKTAQR